MLFTRDFLLEELDETPIVETVLGKGRWTTQYRRVFKHEDKFYETFYSTGNTESQETYPYDDAYDDIECKEVFPVEKTIIVYK